MKPTKPTLYLETSVVSYQTAKPSRDIIVQAHQFITWEFWEKRLKDFNVYISQVVVDEASQGDKEAAVRRLALIRDLPLLSVTAEVDKLAGHYLKVKLLPSGAGRDAYHIALASVHHMDYLLTCNCCHINSASVRRDLAEVNSRFRLGVPQICTPGEM